MNADPDPQPCLGAKRRPLIISDLVLDHSQHLKLIFYLIVREKYTSC